MQIISQLLLLILFISFVNYTIQAEHYPNWMEEDYEKIKHQTLLGKNKKLLKKINSSTDLTLPGTHQSASYYLTDEVSPQLPEIIRRLATQYGISLSMFYKKWSINQLRNITEQFNSGIRKFDIRVCSDEKGILRNCHGLFGLPTIDFILQIKDFMNKHKKEIALIEFSSRGGPVDHEKLINMIKENLGNLLADSSKGFQTIESMIQKNERLIIVYNEGRYTGGKIWNRKFIDSHWANTENVDQLMEFNLKRVHQFSGLPQKFYIGQWLATPQIDSIISSVLYKLNLPGQTSAMDGIPRLMFPINEKLNEFVKRTLRYRLNVLYIDVSHGVDVVALSRLLNDNCNDEIQYRGPKKDGCRDLASKGRCENPDEFIKKNCKRTCLLCPKIKGFSGDSCSNNSECHSKKCKISKGFCLSNKPKSIGSDCGTNYQCSTGFCNPMTLKCQGNFIGEKCETYHDCLNKACQSGKCTGIKQYKWIGLDVICNGFPDRCSLSGLSYHQSSYSTSKCGNSEFCFTGNKILCSNFIQEDLKQTFWLPIDPNDTECNVSEFDCEKHNSTFVLKSKCGTGVSICQKDKFRVLCVKNK